MREGNGTKKRWLEEFGRLHAATTSLDDPAYLVYRGLFAALDRASAQATGKLLDIGCAEKPYEKMFEGRVTEHLGCDVEQSVDRRVDIICSATAIPLEDASVDTVLCTQVIEHVADHRGLLREALRLLRPGGALILSAPMYWPLHLEPHDFFRFTKYGLRHVLEDAGFSVDSIESNGGKWAVCGLVLIHSIEHTRLMRRRVVRLINTLFARLDDWRPDDRNTSNYVVVAHKPQAAGAPRPDEERGGRGQADGTEQESKPGAL
jgi:SAM-dependent methyltransferase